jgi:hypothetical protein
MPSLDSDATIAIATHVACGQVPYRGNFGEVTGVNDNPRTGRFVVRFTFSYARWVPRSEYGKKQDCQFLSRPDSFA